MIKIASHPIYHFPLPEGHRFPMIKYELIPRQLLREGIISEEQLFAPGPVEESIVLLTHDKNYILNLKQQTLSDQLIRKIGFPLTPELYFRELILVQGTIDCALYALHNKISLNVAGGTHHAFTGSGEGFCLLNDCAVAAHYLLHEKKVSRVLILDLDVHQGNGTAQIFKNDRRVYTFSMHGKNNYPFHKETSTQDIELPDGIKDEEYLSLLYKNLPLAIEKHQPEIIFYISGVDILDTDKFGKLGVSKAGCQRRDDFVFSECLNRNIPITVTMGGGYSAKISDIVDAHCNTFKSAISLFFQ